MNDRTHIDLCSGIGGFALAARWTGFRTIAFCEKDEWCQRVLAKNFGAVPCESDLFDFNIDSYCQSLYDSYDDQIRKEIIMGAKRKNYDGAMELYESGFSIGDVADYYQVTRQAMWAILKLRGCKFRPNLRFGEKNHFWRGTLADDHAQNIVEKAISLGKLQPAPCEVCGANGVFADGRREVQAHHDDYNFPLKVRWLCQKHHHAWHKNNKAVQRKEVISREANCRSGITLVTAGFP